MAFHPSEPLTMGDREFSSRLLVGTGYFSGNESMTAAILQEGDSLEIVQIVAGG
jgi:thiazole synthase ThiGH ThiG subunit